MEKSITVANWFIAKDMTEGDDKVCPIRVQKLVFLAYGWHLALTEKPLIREAPLARSWGPYFQLLLNEITESFCWNSTGSTLLEGQLSGEKVSPDLEDFLDKIWEVHNKFSSVQLSRLVTYPDSPWQQTLNNNPGREHIQIPDSLIQVYYKNRLKSV